MEEVGPTIVDDEEDWIDPLDGIVAEEFEQDKEAMLQAMEEESDKGDDTQGHGRRREGKTR